VTQEHAPQVLPQDVSKGALWLKGIPTDLREAFVRLQGLD